MTDAVTDKCGNCGRELQPDEIAIYKRLVNRGATSYLCIPCLSAHFRVDESLIREIIRHFRNQGCTLFGPEEDSNG